MEIDKNIEIDKECCDYIAQCYDLIGPLVMPAINRVTLLLQNDPKFQIGLQCSGVYAEPPILRAGVSAERLNFPIDHVNLSFGCTVIAFPGQKTPQLTISVGWHRSFLQNHHAGFSVYESHDTFRLQSIDNGVRLVKQHLPQCEQRMRLALQRGTLPRKLTHWLHRLARGVPAADIYPLQGGKIHGLPNVHTFASANDVNL